MIEQEKQKNDLILERINRLIKKSGMTQSEVSVKCNFDSPRRLQNLSGGHRLPDCDEAVKIAKTLNTSVEFIVTGQDSSLSEDKMKLIALYDQVDDSLKPVIFDFFNSLLKRLPPVEQPQE